MENSPRWMPLLVALIFFAISMMCFNLFIPRDQLLYLYDSKRFFLLALLIIVALCVILSNALKTQIVDQYHALSAHTKLVLWALVFTSLVPTLFSVYRVSAITQWLHLGGLVMLASVLVCYFRREHKLFFSMSVWLSILLFFSVAYAFWYRLSHSLPVNNSVFVSFANPRFLSQVQIWFFLPVAYLAHHAVKRGKGFIGPVLLLSMNFSVCFTLDARGALLAAIVGFVVMMVADGANRKRWAKLLLISLALGWIISLVLFNPFPAYLFDLEFSAPEIRVDSSGRVALWLETLAFSSFWGHGGGAFACQPFDFARPHNVWLNILVHWGLPSVLLCSLLVVMLAVQVLRTHHRQQRVLGANLLTGLAYSLVSGVLDSPLSQLVATLALASYWATFSASTANVLVGRVQSISMSALALCVALSSGYLGYKRWDNYPHHIVQNEVKANGLRTQFWVGYNCLEKKDLP